ncbi:MAG: transketolase C-terminal domain-containing protein, partial [FCB group bacterium]|nr:transketolase C-terminal domain-containing protein [FCB group bacterium]
TAFLDNLNGLPIITLEENSVIGGIGSAVLEHYESRGKLHDLRLKRLGFPDAWLEHATREEQLADMALDTAGLVDSLRVFLSEHVHQPVE